MSKKVRIAILASGSGTNAEKIMAYFKSHDDIQVALVGTNRPKAGVIDRAKAFGVSTLVFSQEELESPDGLLKMFQKRGIDFVILAGFLKKIPAPILEAYPDRILNIHPALLPKFGGKGMYGERVHKAVLEAGEKESGITIHLVNAQYDEGSILFQGKCEVEPGFTAADLAKKVQLLEHQHYPKVIEDYISKSIKNL